LCRWGGELTKTGDQDNQFFGIPKIVNASKIGLYSQSQHFQVI
jgi:hypothetical protein